MCKKTNIQYEYNVAAPGAANPAVADHSELQASQTDPYKIVIILIKIHEALLPSLKIL